MATKPPTRSHICEPWPRSDFYRCHQPAGEYSQQVGDSRQPWILNTEVATASASPLWLQWCLWTRSMWCGQTFTLSSGSYVSLKKKYRPLNFLSCVYIYIYVCTCYINIHMYNIYIYICDFGIIAFRFVDNFPTLYLIDLPLFKSMMTRSSYMVLIPWRMDAQHLRWLIRVDGFSPSAHAKKKCRPSFQVEIWKYQEYKLKPM